MHRGVKQRCVRCIVQLSLQKVAWQDSNKRDVHLDGPMVFLRACVLGQLQHSHLHRPLFPLELNQQLQFDRVFTNCKNPLLFGEMVQGEHVRIEIIQLSEDCTGGRVLARYEASAHTFLFPDEPGSQDGDIRHVELTRQSKAVQQNKIPPPVLSFTTSTVLLEATVHSPVSPLFVGQGVEKDGDPCSTRSSPEKHTTSELASPGSNSNASGESTRESPQKAASSGLSKGHREPFTGRSSAQVACKPAPATVKFKPRKVNHHTRPTDDVLEPGHEEDTHADGRGHVTDKPLYYRTVTSDIGLHPWQKCPRRKHERLVARSAPSVNSSPLWFEHKRRANETLPLPNLTPVDGLRLERTDPALYPCSPPTTIPDLRPPFVVRHADPSVLSRRDFCGASSPPSVVRHGRPTCKNEAAAGDEDQILTPPPSATVVREAPNLRTAQSGPSLSELYEKYLDGTGAQSASERASLQLTSTTTSSSNSPAAASHFGGRGGKAATPMAEAGNVLSPAKQIEEKVQRLRKECCSHAQHSADSVAEDSLNEDLNRLRASLAAECHEAFRKDAIPDTGLTVQVGPDEYWSQRMAEYTGHPHRLLFDETLEKIYHRLYQGASVIK